MRRCIAKREILVKVRDSVDGNTKTFRFHKGDVIYVNKAMVPADEAALTFIEPLPVEGIIKENKWNSRIFERYITAKDQLQDLCQDQLSKEEDYYMCGNCLEDAESIEDVKDFFKDFASRSVEMFRLGAEKDDLEIRRDLALRQLCM